MHSFLICCALLCDLSVQNYWNDSQGGMYEAHGALFCVQLLPSQVVKFTQLSVDQTSYERLNCYGALFNPDWIIPEMLP